MFRRNLMPVWIAILLLSSIYLMGQEAWNEPLLCEDSVAQMNSQACLDQAYANVDTLKTCLVVCGGNGSCEDLCWEDWDNAISDCNPGVATLRNGDCGPCYASCFGDFIQSCMYDAGRTGAECLDELIPCANEC